MFKIYGLVSPILLFLLSLFLVGCSSSKRLTEVINVPNEKWRVTSVVVSQSDDVWRVSGRLNSPNIHGLPEGYVLVSIISNNGALLDQKMVEYKRIIGAKRRRLTGHFGLALFTVTFESIPEKAKVVTEHIINPTRINRLPPISDIQKT